jgi:hypothetical protein
MPKEAAASTSGPIDGDKLQRFVGKMLGDLGGAASVPLVRMGDALGLYRILHWRARPRSTSATCANGSLTKPHPTTSPTIRRAAGSACRPSRPWCSLSKIAPFT